jgi:DHA1 family tetracycline resistance protein-like MFS transporter
MRDSADEKLDFKKILPVFMIVLIDLLGLTIIIPLLPLYAASFGADPGTIGLLSATYPLMQFIGAPILGRLSDRYGRKPILLVSQLGTFFGFVLLGFASALPILFLSRIIDGLSGANISTAQAIIADSTTEKTRTQGLGLLGAAFGLGFIVGPLIAFTALALSGNNYHVPAFVAAIFSLASIVLTWFRLEETHPSDAQQKTVRRFTLAAFGEALTHPGVGILIVLIFAQQIAFGGFEQFLALLTLSRLGLNASGNAVVFVFVGIVVVMVQGYFIGKWSRRFGERNLIVFGLATLTLGLAMTAFTPAQPAPWYSHTEVSTELSSRQVSGEITQSGVRLPDETDKGWSGILWLLVAMIPASIGGGLLQPSINSLITKRVDANERGGILGISAAFVSAANVAAPLIGGVLFGLASGLPFLVWAAILALLLVLALVALKPETSRVSPAPAVLGASR